MDPPRTRRRTVALPYYRWRLEAAKPKPGYPVALRTVGDHLRKRRLDLGQTGKQTAAGLGVDPETLKNWEEGRTDPEVRFYPALIRFLGYNPLPEPQTRGQAIQRKRISRGLSQEGLAGLAGIDEATVRRLEADTPRMARRSIVAVLGALGLDNKEARS